MFYSAYDLIVVPFFFLALYAQYKVSSTFSKYSEVSARGGNTGAQVARGLLDANGLHHVPVEMVEGRLSDHYDPGAKAVRLSPDVYHGYSVASLGVAAHEVGHAIQHANDYVPLSLRHAFVPVANIGSSLAFPLILIGFFLHWSGMILLGIVFFSAAVLFQVITLPVEFNASNRAMQMLAHYNYVGRDEVGLVKKVLGAAALTYVASALVAVAELVKYVLIFSSSNRDE
ncbi:peptidase [Heliobacterium gestii]|uniref:Peptidase n=1 Tax=Heliomicrobium gestii TaxID=2699 RepID=A0A845LCJ3_HELGE|nr:zinc metallopeptidase [Heliomicrobium gestii]MBM7867544.1 Zn-dependent membrane protease YugP [Heliomicrobium gestii]MZP43908.1 peptidase [Heliomicrobium gestii]